MVVCAAMPQGLRQKKGQSPERAAALWLCDFSAITRCYLFVTVIRYPDVTESNECSNNRRMVILSLA